MPGSPAEALEPPPQTSRANGSGENSSDSDGGQDTDDQQTQQTRRRAGHKRRRGGRASGGGNSNEAGSGGHRYPRKRALRACRLCRVRKTKCDNTQPTCGSCVAIGTSCDYGDSQSDHSSFDHASLEILRKLGDIISAQKDLVDVLRNNNSANAIHNSNSLDSHDNRAGFLANPGQTATADNLATWSTPVPSSYDAIPTIAAHQPSAATAQMAAPLGATPSHRAGGFPLNMNAGSHSADTDDAMAMRFTGSAAHAVHAGDDTGAPMLSGEAVTARWVELLADDAVLGEQMMAMCDADADEGMLDSGLFPSDRTGGGGPGDNTGRGSSASTNGDVNGNVHESTHDEDLATIGTANGLTPLQQAAKIADDWRDTAADASVAQPPDGGLAASSQQQQRQAEEQLWHTREEIQLLPQERLYFVNFLDRLSKWIDLFDRMEQFSSLVPHLALHNAGLLNAIFALSCRHLSLNPGIYPDAAPIDRNVALQYYYQTLHYVQKAMRFRSYQTSLELLATTLIVSTYEMIDGCRKAWERHLEGACWILRSQITEVETTDFKSAVWWTWLRQDVWAAFSERRKAFTDWIPVKPYATLTPYELASRTVWIMAQVVNFCAALPEEADPASPAPTSSEGPVPDRLSASAPPPLAATAASIALFRQRLQRAGELQELLREWRAHLTAEFLPLPISDGHRGSVEGQQGQQPSSAATVFEPMYVRPACLGVALQVHHASRVLLCANMPSTGNFATFLQQQATIQECIKIICGIAMTLTNDASSLMSSQCLFIAGISHWLDTTL
ncbi:hypothetical protein SCUCBS95973_008665 [Sporothrix curviconia]|uniref:Zn(2)-C6 fungal-type domain-containing protein n=1 Tax=Sporothrix curviconia TaxID=1260050 RepID=A0ABP0CNU2_9PEZI